jgi:zinc transport system substrate-binding protein
MRIDLRCVRVAAVVARTILVYLAVGILAGCGGDTRSADNAGSARRETVVAAFYPLAYLAQEIGGERVDVTNLTPAGAEPHDIELTPRDVENIRDADVVLYLGHGFQPAVEDAAAGASGKTVDLLSGVRLRASAEEGEATDPHAWLDPVLFRHFAERVGEALGRPDGVGRLSAQLTKLDAAYRTGLARCRRHAIVTSHAAFGYLAQRYGLKQIAIAGLTPEAEPTPRDLEHIVDEVRRSGATTVFFEELVSPRIAETVAHEVGARTAVLNPIEGLTPAEQERGEDYVSVMRSNLAALRRALGCR